MSYKYEFLVAAILKIFPPRNCDTSVEHSVSIDICLIAL
jgi:hypothetical protein